MIQKIKDEILESLENNFIEYEYEIVKSHIDNILLKHHNNQELYDYKVICDNTNNYLDTDEYLNIEIYIKPTKLSNILVNNMIITKDRGKFLRKNRKKKLENLNKIYENY